MPEALNDLPGSTSSQNGKVRDDDSRFDFEFRGTGLVRVCTEIELALSSSIAVPHLRCVVAKT